MKQRGLQAPSPRRYRSTTDSGHALPVAPHVLARAFWAQAPNEAWVGDIPFIAGGAGLALSVRAAGPVFPSSHRLIDERYD